MSIHFFLEMAFDNDSGVESPWPASCVRIYTRKGLFIQLLQESCPLANDSKKINVFARA